MFLLIEKSENNNGTDSQREKKVSHHLLSYFLFRVASYDVS